MDEYIKKEALIKAIQEDYENREQGVYKGLFSNGYRVGVEDELNSVIKIIENIPYFVKGEICTTLEED